MDTQDIQKDQAGKMNTSKEDIKPVEKADTSAKNENTQKKV